MSRINLLARDNGVGLSRDLAILARTLSTSGVELTVTAIGHGKAGNALRHVRLRAKLAIERWREGPAQGRFDLNLMCERIWPEYVPLARRNAFLPNPEWFKSEFRPHLDAIDCVFAKTHHAQALFEALGCRTRFTGFTSFDRLRQDVVREPRFLHLAGHSGSKGTRPLVDLWRRHPEWPTLTIVQHSKRRLPTISVANIAFLTRYLGDEELAVLQNRAQLQLCPSETEGFGHHLVEGMSTGAVVLTTDAPPMNEMIAADRGVLVGYGHTGTQQLATTYLVDPLALQSGVEYLLDLDESERRRLGDHARAWWEDNDRQFRHRLLEAVSLLVA